MIKVPKTTSTKNRVEFQGGINLAYLTSVTALEIKNKNNEMQWVLDFKFSSYHDDRANITQTNQHVFATGEREYTHREFPIREDDDKFDKKMGWMSERLAHIYGAFGEMQKDFAGKDWQKFFEHVAERFNTDGEGGKPIFSTSTPVWLLVTYNNDNRVQLPFPNFIDRFAPQKATILSINPTYHTVERIQAPRKPQGPGGGMASFGPNGGGANDGSVSPMSGIV